MRCDRCRGWTPARRSSGDRTVTAPAPSPALTFNDAGGRRHGRKIGDGDRLCLRRLVGRGQAVEPDDVKPVSDGASVTSAMPSTTHAAIVTQRQATTRSANLRVTAALLASHAGARRSTEYAISSSFRPARRQQLCECVVRGEWISPAPGVPTGLRCRRVPPASCRGRTPARVFSTPHRPPPPRTVEGWGAGDRCAQRRPCAGGRAARVELRRLHLASKRKVGQPGAHPPPQRIVVDAPLLQEGVGRGEVPALAHVHDLAAVALGDLRRLDVEQALARVGGRRPQNPRLTPTAPRHARPAGRPARLCSCAGRGARRRDPRTREARRGPRRVSQGRCRV